jgi:hypothetical protein
MRAMLIALLACFFSFAAYGLPNEVSYLIEAELLPLQNVVVGNEILSFTNHSGQALSDLYFHIYPNAFRRGSNSQYQQDLTNVAKISNINSIYADPADDAFMEIRSIASGGQPLIHSINDTLLTVNLAEPLPDGETIEIEISFVNNLMEATEFDRMAFNRAIRSAHRNGVYTIALWHPRLAVLDSEGWHLEPYRFVGEFYGDFGSYDVQIAVPGDFEVGATGELALEILEPNRKIVRYRADNVHDFSWVASRNYFVEERIWRGVTVRSLNLEPEDAIILDQVIDALEFYSDEFGEYAYSTFTVANVTTGGGMEYPSIVLIGNGTVQEVVHEVAHQWWYAAIGNNQYEEAWLDEGFTTFAEERYLIEENGENEIATRSSFRFREPREIILQPASEYPSLSNYALSVYSKGSGVLWMLRSFLGHDQFDALLRDYYFRFKFQNVTAQDFIQFVNEYTGQNLDWFFDQWLKTTKSLDFVLEDVRSTTSSAGNIAHTIVVRRDGDAVMPVSIVVQDADGLEPRIIDWDTAEQRAEFHIEGISGIAEVVIDPQRVVLEQNRNNNTWTPLGMVALLIIVGMPTLIRIRLWRRL